jgi:hypothetical protein
MTRTAVRLMCLTTAVGAALATSGCGSGNKPLGQLKGKVLFNGKPVPAGYISFTPDSSKGGHGSVKVAQIKDGAYDTAQGSDPGVIPGPTVIRIAGFDGQPVRLFAQGKQIFNPYELHETLAAGENQKDFVVPPSAAKDLRIEPTADH